MIRGVDPRRNVGLDSDLPQLLDRKLASNPPASRLELKATSKFTCAPVPCIRRIEA
jgi:hypothetical protein